MNILVCALSAVMATQSGPNLYKVCEYRCPREVSYTYYHYPKVIYVQWDMQCPPYTKYKTRNK
jgi:hypothetical protein